MNATRSILPLLFAVSLIVPASATGADREWWRYTVRPGDTLSQIAEKYLDRTDSWKEVQALNKVADPNRLKPGSTLRIPYALGGGAAEVVWVQGEARRSGGASPMELARGAQLKMGDTVQTGPGSSVTLRLPDQSRLLVSANSRITLAHLVRSRKLAQGEVRIALDLGAAESIVTPRKKLEARYEVKTPALSLAVRGTRFRVAVDDRTGTTRATVSEGTVEASAMGKTVILTQGTGTVAARGAEPSAPFELLQAPTLDAPAAVLETLPAGFSWQPLTGAQQYRVELLDGAGQTQLEESFTDAPSVRWAGIPDGEYQLRVRGIDGSGLEGRAAIHGFALKTRPEPPLLRLPVAGGRVDGSQADGNKVEFRWTQPQGVQRYRFQISDSATFERSLNRLLQTPESAQGVDLRLSRGLYFWRVAAAGADGNFGPYSDPQSFRIGKGGESAAVPLDASGMVTLRWKAGQSGQRYQVQVALDPDFGAPLLDAVQAGNEAIFLQQGKGPYFVRIRRIDTGGLSGGFEPGQQFTIDPAP